MNTPLLDEIRKEAFRLGGARPLSEILRNFGASMKRSFRSLYDVPLLRSSQPLGLHAYAKMDPSQVHDSVQALARRLHFIPGDPAGRATRNYLNSVPFKVKQLVNKMYLSQ